MPWFIGAWSDGVQPRPSPEAANTVPVAYGNGGSSTAKQLWISVLGSAIVTFGAPLLQKVPWLAQKLGQVFSFRPLWAALFLLFFAIFGAISMVQKSIAVYRAKRLRSEPLELGLIEVDLRSYSAIDARIIGDIPQVWVTLEIINHSCEDIAVTALSGTITFGQTKVAVSTAQPRVIETHTTGTDIFLTADLSDTAARSVDRFFDDETNQHRAVYVSVELVLSCNGRLYTKPVMTFDRHLPEILSIRKGRLVNE